MPTSVLLRICALSMLISNCPQHLDPFTEEGKKTDYKDLHLLLLGV